MVHEELQDIMGNHAGIVREKEELIQGIQKLDDIKLTTKVNGEKRQEDST